MSRRVRSYGFFGLVVIEGGHRADRGILVGGSGRDDVVEGRRRAKNASLAVVRVPAALSRVESRQATSTVSVTEGRSGPENGPGLAGRGAGPLGRAEHRVWSGADDAPVDPAPLAPAWLPRDFLAGVVIGLRGLGWER
jgi:hypothetical protein